MRITKLGHCCLLVETKEVRLLTDPGLFTAAACAELSTIDIIVITHEHGDHLHVSSVVDLVARCPDVVVVCNHSVGRLLDEAGVTHQVLEGTADMTVSGIALRAWDGPHAEIYQEVGQVPTTGYLIDDALFLPGDSWSVPEYDVDTLALPVAGPWCRIKDAIDFALAVQPQTVFPVHDGLLNETGQAITYPHPERELNAAGMRFVSLTAGESFAC